MNRSRIAAAAAIPALMLSIAPAMAQEEEQSPYVYPVDTFTCSYKDRKGPDDLEKVIAGWNEYMDEQGADSYGAMVITPNYYGQDTFEVGWLGYWPSQEAMGAGMDNYRATGKKIAASFDAVLDCDTHSHFASIEVKAAPEGEPPDDIVLMFSNCTRNEDLEWDEVFERINNGMDYLESVGNEGGAYMMWPVFGGEGEPPWDFKWVSSWESYTAFGKAYQHNANGGGRQKMNEIMGDALDCDTSRVYDARVVRRITAEMPDD